MSPDSRTESEPPLPRRSSLTTETIAAMFWMFSGHGVRVFVRVAITIVLARLLPPADFGVAAGAFTLIHFAEIFGQLGVGPAVVQRRELEERHIRTAFTFSVVFGLVLGGILWLLAPLFSLFFREPGVEPVVRVAVLVFPLHGLAVVGESLLQRDLRFRRLMTIEVWALGLGFGLVGIATASSGWGVWALVAATLAQAALRSVLILILQPHPRRPGFEPAAFRELISFGGGMTFARFSNYLALQGDSLVVGRWLGMEALGFYSRAFSLVGTLSNLIGQALEKVLFASMAKVQDRPDRLAKAYGRGLAVTSIVLLPGSIVTSVLAPEIIQVLLGPAWSGMVAPFQILALGMTLRTGYKLGVSLATAVGAVYRNAWRQAVFATLVIGGAWLGRHWGLAGVAWAVLAALAVHFVSIGHLSIGLLPYSWRRLLTTTLPAVALASFVGIESWLLAGLLRAAAVPAAIILLATGGAVAVSVLILIRLLPARAFGEETSWMVASLADRLPAWLALPARRMRIQRAPDRPG